MLSLRGKVRQSTKSLRCAIQFQHRLASYGLFVCTSGFSVSLEACLA